MVRPHMMAAGPVSRRFDVASIRDSGASFRLQASEAEKRALATQAGLAGIDAFDADFALFREGQERVRVTGRVRADLRQICVVSLDEFRSRLDEPVDVLFAPEADVAELVAARAAQPASHDDEAELEDLPDPIVGGRIDLGVLAAEMLVLGLDPHPRKPGAAFVEPHTAPDGGMVSPFAALKGLRGGDAG